MWDGSVNHVASTSSVEQIRCNDTQNGNKVITTTDDDGWVEEEVHKCVTEMVIHRLSLWRRTPARWFLRPGQDRIRLSLLVWKEIMSTRFMTGALGRMWGYCFTFHQWFGSTSVHREYLMKWPLTAHHPPTGPRFLLPLCANFVNWFSRCYHRQRGGTRDEFRPLDLEQVCVRSLMGCEYVLGC